MFSQNPYMTKKLLKHFKRYWSDGNLIVKNDSKDAVVNLAPCMKSKSRKMKDDEPENVWLQNLNLKNIKLYRKTSFGSYRKINVQNFIEKLKVILPNEFDTKKTDVKSSGNSLKNEPEQVEKKENLIPSPHLCEFVIQNMDTFPLFKSQCEDSLKGIIKDGEELEKVDTTGFPSVTRILQETMSPENKERLDRWQLQMIQKMGPEKFLEYKNDIFNQGSKFHGALRKYLESREESLVSIDQTIEGCWNSVAKVLEDINNVMMLEQSVHHPILSYKGYVDCVASYRDVPYVIEWKKTSKKIKGMSKLYDAPVQACAYLGALSWRKNPAPTAPNKCLLVIAYTNGDPADVFPLDREQCLVYWSNFLHRLQSFWAKKWPDLKSKESRP